MSNCACLPRLGLVACLLLTAGCGNDPDLLAFGARELPGTVDADYLTARPFSVSPDASMLVFATPLVPEQHDGEVLEFDRGRLESFRILDLETGSKTAFPTLPPTHSEMLERYGLLHEAPCWNADSHTLLFRTRSRSYLKLGPLHADPTWSLVREAPAGLDPECGKRSAPFIGSRAVGRFRVEGANTQVTVSDARLSPGGDRLAIVYSRGLGSFTGKAHAAVVSTRADDAPARPLGSGVLIVDWLDQRRLVGYARPDGRREYALFTWMLD
jgi:hypothetical protein